MQTKACTKCKEVKPVSEFYKRKDAKDGLNSQCKKCVCERSRRYQEANKERVAERRRRYYEANKEKIAEKGLRYRENNKEKIAERDRRYREVNKAQRNRAAAKLFSKNNECSLEIAYRQGLPWEDWEDEFVAADNGFTVYQKAVKLERSYCSVKHKQIRLRKKSRNELTNDTVRV